MLEIPVREVHLPDLHLAERVSNFEWPRIDLPSFDVGKAVTDAAAAAHIGRRPHRPRWPLAVGGLIVVGLASWVILSNEAVRARLTGGANAIRERISVVRSHQHDPLEIEREDPIAFPAAETASIEPSFGDSTTSDVTGYPAGLGSNNGDRIPISAETGSPG